MHLFIVHHLNIIIQSLYYNIGIFYTLESNILFAVNRRSEMKTKINANLKKMNDIELVANDTKRLPAVKASGP